MKQGITAEQVRAGMVFDHLPTGKRVTTIRLYSERPETIACRPRAWECNPGGVLLIAGPEFALLGCDPALAARSDCELFGIAEGFDAAAHGFARTREGGAVDLRKDGGRGMVKEWRGQRWAGDGALAPDERFIGLDASRAYPESISRLCCGAPAIGKKHITETGKRDVVCSLAIGDHDHHEDIAAGVKWLATMTGTWSSGMAGAPVTHVGALAKDGSGDISVYIRAAGYGCEVVSMSPPVVKILGAKYFEVSGLVAKARRRLEGIAPYVSVVTVHSCGACGCEGTCAWRTEQKADPDAVICETCQCRWCGPMTSEFRARREAPAAPKVSPTADVGKQAAIECAEFARQWARVEKGQAAQRYITSAEHGAQAFCAFIGRLKAWAASPAGRIAARDAAVHKAIADVPDGCDAERWGNVVRVIAADVFESAGHHGACEYATNKIHEAIADCAPSVQMYAAMRFVHRYSAAEATREVVRAGGADGCPATARLLSAYEAGR